MNVTSAVLYGKTRSFLTRGIVATLFFAMFPVLFSAGLASGGAATQLIVTTQPAGATNGAAFSTPVVVSAEDGSGNVDTTFSGSVTATFATGTGTLANATVTAVSGVATFSTLTITGLVGLYSLTFASSGLTSATSGAFELSAGTATQLVYVRAPAGAASGVALTTQPVIDVEDASGNVVLGASGTVNAVLTTGTGTLANASASIVSGEATFNALTITGTSGSVTLTFFASGISGVSTVATTLTMTGGTATQMVITQIPTNATSGVALATTTIPIISFEDANGNVSPVTPKVTISIASGSGSLSLAYVTAAAGVAKFTGLTITAYTPGPFTLLFQAPGYAPVTSSAIEVAGVATKLVLTTQPSGATSGSALTQQPVVAIEDASGNVITTDSATTVTAAFATGSGTLANNSVKAVNGIVTFTALKITAASGAYTLAFSATGLTSATSGSFTVSGAASALSLATQPAGAANGSAFATQPVVKVVDANGNVVTAYVGSVTAVVLSGSGSLIGTTSATFTNGIATFTNLGVSGAGTSVTIGFLATGVSMATSNALSVSTSATKLVLTTAPAGVVSGVAFTTQPVVKVEDASGNVVSGYTGTVSATLTSGSGTLSNASATITAGVATFTSLSFTGSGSFSVTFSSSPLASATSATLSAAGVATKLAITTQPYGVVSGVAFTTQPVIYVEDASGNLVTSATGTVSATFASGSGALTNATANVTGGVATFSNLTFTGTGSFVLAFTSSGLTGVQSATLSAAGVATKLAIATEPYGVVSGVAFTTQPVIYVEDANGNLVTSATGTVSATFASGSGALTNATANVTGGVATFSNLTFTGTGSFVLVFTSSGLTSVQSATLSEVGTGTRLVISTEPSGSVAGLPLALQPVVKVEDVYGNVITNYNAPVTASIDYGSGTVTNSTAVAVNGVVTFTSLAITGTTGSVALLFQGAGVTAAVSSLFSVNVGPATQLVVVPPYIVSSSSGVAAKTSPVVAIEDVAGNIVTSYTGTVSATLASGSGLLSGATANLVNGVATFGALSVTGSVGSYQLRFSVAGFQTSTALTFEIAGAPAKLVFSVAPSTSVASGATLASQPVVEVEDSSGYLVGSASGTVKVTMSPSTGTALGASVNLVNGVATFSALALDAKVGTYTLDFTSSLLSAPLSARIQVLVGTPVKLVVATLPSTDTQSGQSLTVQPVLELVDAYGNVVPTSGIAQVALTNASPASGTGPTTTIQHNQATLANGVAHFSGLSLRGAAGPVKVTFSADGLATTTTLFIRAASFFAPVRVGFAPGSGYLSAGAKSQVLAFGARMSSMSRIIVVGYAPYNVALALFRARQAAAVLATHLKATFVIRYDTFTRLNEVFLEGQ